MSDIFAACRRARKRQITTSLLLFRPLSLSLAYLGLLLLSLSGSAATGSAFCSCSVYRCSFCGVMVATSYSSSRSPIMKSTRSKGGSWEWGWKPSVSRPLRGEGERDEGVADAAGLSPPRPSVGLCLLPGTCSTGRGLCEGKGEAWAWASCDGERRIVSW